MKVDDTTQHKKPKFRSLWEVWKLKGKGGSKGGPKYLAGYIDLGILGRKEVYLFKNERREKDNQPAFRLVIKEGDSWKEADTGVLLCIIQSRK